MDVPIWKYTTEIDDEVVRSPQSFTSRGSAITYVEDIAYGMSRTFGGGKGIMVSREDSPHGDQHIIQVHNASESLVRFVLTRITTDDELIEFNTQHPYLHKILEI